MSRRFRLRGLVVALAVAVAPMVACGDDDAALDVDEAGEEPADYTYVIPVGAGEALDRGEPLEILPAELEVEVGEIIEIENQDDRGHTVGPFFVGGNETLRQRFTSAGEYIGICTVHPSGEIVLTVL